MGCLRGSKWKAAGLLVGSALCTALSGLQSVMVTSWLQPFLLLQFVHHIVVVVGGGGDQSSGKRTRTSSSSSWGGRLLLLFLLTLLVQSLGFTVAFGGMFNDPSFTLPGVLTVLFVSTIAWLVLCIPFLASLVYRRRYGGATLSQPLVFASIWTALWHLAASKAPIGSVGNPAYSQASVKPLVLTASVWGVDGIVFLLAWAASIAHESIVLADSEMGGDSETRHFVEGCACSSQDHTPGTHHVFSALEHPQTLASSSQDHTLGTHHLVSALCHLQTLASSSSSQGHTPGRHHVFSALEHPQHLLLLHKIALQVFQEDGVYVPFALKNQSDR
jgi:hypothetical protein